MQNNKKKKRNEQNQIENRFKAFRENSFVAYRETKTEKFIIFL